jgi:hypothetical protein
MTPSLWFVRKQVLNVLLYTNMTIFFALTKSLFLSLRRFVCLQDSVGSFGFLPYRSSDFLFRFFMFQFFATYSQLSLPRHHRIKLFILKAFYDSTLNSLIGFFWVGILIHVLFCLINFYWWLSWLWATTCWRDIIAWDHWFCSATLKDYRQSLWILIVE